MLSGLLRFTGLSMSPRARGLLVVALGLRLRGRDRRQAVTEGQEWLARLGLAGFERGCLPTAAVVRVRASGVTIRTGSEGSRRARVGR